MSRRNDLSSVHPTTTRQTRDIQKQFLSKDNKSGGQNTNEKKGRLVASMVSVFDSASSKEQVVPTPEGMKTPAVTPSNSPKVTARVKHEEFVGSKHTPLRHSPASPRSHANKISVASSSVESRGLSDRNDPRIQRTLEFFNKGKAATLNKQSSSGSLNPSSDKQKCTTLPSQTSSSLGRSSVPAKITITSTKSKLSTSVSTKTDSLRFLDQKVSSTDKKIAAKQSCLSSTVSQSSHEPSKDTQVEKASRDISPHAAYTLTHSPSPSPSSSGSSCSFEPPSPSPRSSVIKQPGGVWYSSTSDVSPTSPPPCGDQLSMGIPRRRSFGSTPGCGRRKSPSPGPSSLTSSSNPHQSSLVKSMSTDTFSCASSKTNSEVKTASDKKLELSTVAFTSGCRPNLHTTTSFRRERERSLPPLNKLEQSSKLTSREKLDDTAQSQKRKTSAPSPAHKEKSNSTTPAHKQKTDIVTHQAEKRKAGDATKEKTSSTAQEHKKTGETGVTTRAHKENVADFTPTTKKEQGSPTSCSKKSIVTILPEPAHTESPSASSTMVHNSPVEDTVVDESIFKYGSLPPPKVLGSSASKRRPLPSPKPITISPVIQRKAQLMEEKSNAASKHRPTESQASHRKFSPRVSSYSQREPAPVSVKSRIAMFKSIQQEHLLEKPDDQIKTSSLKRQFTSPERKAVESKKSPTQSHRNSPVLKKTVETEQKTTSPDDTSTPCSTAMHQPLSQPQTNEASQQDKADSSSSLQQSDDEEELTLSAIKIVSNCAEEGEKDVIEISVFPTDNNTDLSRGTSTPDMLQAAPCTSDDTEAVSPTCIPDKEPVAVSPSTTVAAAQSAHQQHLETVSPPPLPPRPKSPVPCPEEGTSSPSTNDGSHSDATATTDSKTLSSGNSYENNVIHSQETVLSTSADSARRGFPLESIPEYDVAETRQTPLPSDEPIPSGRVSASDREHSSSDSETEFYRRLSTVTGSFYEEMLASITATIGNECVTIPQQRGEMGEKEFSSVVNRLVQQNPELAENIYESIEQYRRRSQFVIKSGFNTDAEEPPALPPRPDKLARTAHPKTEHSDLSHEPFDSYVEMNPQGSVEMLRDATSSTVLRSHSHEMSDDASYEPVLLHSPKKKRKSSKRSASLTAQVEVERKKTDESKQSTRKKSRFQGLFSRAKTEPCPKEGNLTVISVFDIGKHGLLDAARADSPFPVSQRYELVDYTQSTKPVPNAPRTSISLPPSSVLHTYKSDDHGTYISPTQTSESEDEENNQFSGNNESPPSVQPKSPRKIKSTTSLPRLGNGASSLTPDSGVYPELSPTHSFKRITRDPLTPPLVTKLSISRSSSSGFGEVLPTSNSDPSIHNTLLTISNKAKNLPIHDLKDSASPTGSLTKLSLMDLALDSDQDTASLDSSRGDRLWMSPIARKRCDSDSPEKLRGSVQKEQLLAHARRRGSSQDSGSTCPEAEDCIVIPLVLADAVMDRTSIEPEELCFSVNDVIAVLDMTDDDWWQGMVDDKMGWFPASWVRLRIGQDNEDSSSEDASEDDKRSQILENGHDIEPVEEQKQQQQHSESVEGCETSPSEPTCPPVLNGEVKSPVNGCDDVSTGDSIGELPSKSQQQPAQPQSHVRKGSRRMTITRRATLHERPRKLTSTEVRARCVNEILTTERQYVEHLRDIIEGYLYPCQQHKKLFNAQQIETIFANVEDIYRFQVKFLQELEAQVVQDKMEDSQIGHVFVHSQKDFSTYSEYCNNHPHAVNEMNILQQDTQYTFFFESCRLLRNLTDISLDGFLLTPVQKICKYPLQLSELLKYTPDTHPDYPHVLAAREAMKEVAMLINERKRRLENIGQVAVWQEIIDNWKGEDMLDRSTELLHSGELHKISKGHSQERHFFLFDHQLVYCKKDTIGGRLSYKGRVNMDKCVVKNLNDGEVSHNASGVRNAWKMRNVDKDKWYVLYARSAEEKEAWMSAFQQERLRVVEDEKKGFVVTKKMKKSAVALYCGTLPTRRTKVHTLRRNSEWVTESACIQQPAQRLESFTKSLTASQADKKRHRRKR